VAPSNSDGVWTAFSGPDANRLLDVEHEDLAVADAAGVGGLNDRVDGLLEQLVRERDLDLDLRQEIDDVLGAAVEFGMSLLSAEALLPIPCRASLTSSSLNGLMMASIFFIPDLRSPPRRPRASATTPRAAPADNTSDDARECR
jgi:hypothetical protein